MRTYNVQGQGCLVLAIIMALLFMVLTFFGRILFTTPIGIALLIGLGIKYLIDSNRKSKIAKQNYQEFNNSSSYNYGQSKSENIHEEYSDNPSFSREDFIDAEEVTEFKEIDK